MEKEEYLKEYVLKGNNLFSIDKVDRIRDGGTLMLISSGSKKSPFYIHKDNWTLHSEYPTTEENLVTDKATQVYIINRLEKYKKDCEFNLMQANNILNKIKL